MPRGTLPIPKTVIEYRIKQKSTGKFISLGYRNKTVWKKYPRLLIMDTPRIMSNPDDYELYTTTYTIIEIKTKPLI